MILLPGHQSYFNFPFYGTYSCGRARKRPAAAAAASWIVFVHGGGEGARLGPVLHIRIVNNAVRKPISLAVACHWRRNNDHSHFLPTVPHGDKSLFVAKAELIDLLIYYGPFCAGFHFYAPRLAAADISLFRRTPAPLADGVDDKSTARC